MQPPTRTLPDRGPLRHRDRFPGADDSRRAMAAGAVGGRYPGVLVQPHPRCRRCSRRPSPDPEATRDAVAGHRTRRPCGPVPPARRQRPATECPCSRRPCPRPTGPTTAASVSGLRAFGALRRAPEAGVALPPRADDLVVDPDFALFMRREGPESWSPVAVGSEGSHSGVAGGQRLVDWCSGWRLRISHGVRLPETQ